jgi:hypothetical protein
MKYYLCALLICGAFFSHNSYGQTVLTCPDGGQPLPMIGGCGIPSPDSGCDIVGVEVTGGPLGTSSYASVDSFDAALSERDMTANPPSCSFGTTNKITKIVNSHDFVTPSCPPDLPPDVITSIGYPITYTVETTSTKRVGSGPVSNLQCTFTDTVTPTVQSSTIKLKWQFTDVPPCPEDYPIGPVFYDDGQLMGNYCYYEPTDEEPPQCDDIFGNCEPDPECVEGGNGLMACTADPNEKCQQTTINGEVTYFNCEPGCGFVNDVFFCSTEPDAVPNFEKCQITETGYVCPSNPNDNIQDPEKPLTDMFKKDFKDVNVGIESRQNITNDLLATQISSEKNNAQQITGAINEMNRNLGTKIDNSTGELKDIGETLDGINDSLNPSELPPIPEPASWYEPVYEDGLSGVWDEHLPALQQTPLFTFLDQFTMAPSGTQPDWNFCFNLGALGNYGCERLEVPSFIWNFIRIVMLLGAAFTARRLIFGG